ncbi:MAG: RNA polymerase factor sigma-54 [Saprospiraceae bacterium]|jgi:RNA polymerase sigma-54 factor|nr:RNA polymerase factor sigma-54 [Saprospiraceae bacterium]MBK7795695.1 RNA polymerase factor sigma-54 [Saprospiraceae bacterium]MBL0260805.1 RNA polymerase factor sigma-54 [Saprospiraceae bacterium]MBX7164289.1 RNA polymerase factor sigma-54 [Saprospiraceae bacterium]
MIKQHVSQKLLQKLSPQQIQLMKLLQIPTSILDQRIQEELEVNPALEEGDEDYDDEHLDRYDKNDHEDPQDSGSDSEMADSNDHFEKEESHDNDFEEYLSLYMDDDTAGYKYKSDDYGADMDEHKTIPVAVENTFHDHLEKQIGLLRLKTEDQYKIALQIIGSIDDDGYLRREPSAIIDDLIFAQNIDTNEKEILAILAKIQTFEPLGVGARNLQECLLIQIRGKQKVNNVKHLQKSLRIAELILEEFFDEFSKKHYIKLQRSLNITESQLKSALDEILKLNPKPSSGYVDAHQPNQMVGHYIIPDFTIVNRDGELELTLNSRNAPDLRVNDHYLEMLRTYKDHKNTQQNNKKEKEAVLFIKQKIESARWFIDAIKQRQDTLYKTMYCIMQYQSEYFHTGDQKKIKPMILKDISEVTSLDISTISRVANSKFVQTEFGTKRLKEFFSESLQNEEGDEVSTLEVKKILSEMIIKESKRKPLSDEKLKELLLRKGYNIARRTIAKYREQLNIPVARLRKELV